MTKPRVGLLPLYLELYDRAMPEIRARMRPFLETLVSQLRERDLEVVDAPVCRLRTEFEGAIRLFEGERADAIVTLHLAYSPSLESADALAGTKLPIIVLDTTPTYAYGPRQDPAELMYNHGIHGVQDMCNVLARSGKVFQIEAGHWEKSDVLDRVASWARAARMATSMRTARVGRIGEAFEGMGDFAIETEVLRRTIGVETVPCEMATLSALLPAEDDLEVESEMKADASRFDAGGVDAQAHRRSVRAGLALRRWIEQKHLSAFSMNFMAFDGASGVPTVPFLEASKALARGVGYAGEGDVLTAALVGALASVNPRTTFTEMFCPDWEGNRVFLSHMGEMNVDLVHGRGVLFEQPFPWSDVENPVVAVGRLQAGEAVLVDLCPGPEDSYTLVVAPVTMADVEGDDKMRDSVRGWLEPAMPVADFLERYSRLGGTHHCALVYGEEAGEIARFGELMGWKVARV